MNTTSLNTNRLPGNTVFDLRKMYKKWLNPLRNLLSYLVAFILMIVLYSVYIYYMSSWLAAD